jgi:Leucine-rich repeat (LRR) protein
VVLNISRNKLTLLEALPPQLQVLNVSKVCTTLFLLVLQTARDVRMQNMLLSLKGLDSCRHLEELDASHNQLMNLKVITPLPP